MSPSSLAFASIADTATMTATVKDAGGTVISGATVTWASTTPSVATVSSAGLVTAVADGTATIIALSESANATAAVTVAQVASTVELSPSTKTLASLGDTVTVSATVKDAGGTAISGATVTWSSSDTTVATVSSAGLVTAVADGTATITATSGSATATSAVTVAHVASSVEVSPSTKTLTSVGDTVTVSATVKDAGGTAISGATVTWSSSDTTVATVSSAGLVTAVADGTATITATSGSASATSAVTVAQAASSVELSPSAKTFELLGDTVTLAATVNDAGGTAISGATVTWESSDTTIATVSSAGLVTAVTNGTDTITATSGSASATAEITVNQVAPILEAITVNWTEGVAATISGTGFSATASSNTVTVDGLTASITSASITELQITVPTSACKPSRVVDVVVTVASESATTTVGVKPAQVYSLELGEGLYTGIGGECLNLDAGSGSEKYIVGFYSSSESASSLTAYTQTAITGTTLAGDEAAGIPIAGDDVGYFEAPIFAAGDLPPAPPPAAAPALTQQVPIDPEQDAIWLRHREAEGRRWEAWRQNRDEAVVREEIALREMAGVRAAEAIARSVGDTISINHGNSCSVYDTLSTVVRYIGTSAFYLEDLDNPVDTSFTAAEYADLDATFSGTAWPKLKEYYGEQYTGVFGLDDADRVAVVVTKEVNGSGSLGYVSSADFRLPSGCARSNDGELFFGLAPDPTGVHGTVRSHEATLDYYPALLAHESTHILQLTQSELLGAASKAVWEIEGGATMAEWLVGNEILGHGGANQNLGLTEFRAGYDWYKDLVNDLAWYFGYSSSGHVEGAPEQCTWLARNPPGVCGGGGRAVYGAPAALLRLILDWFGPGYSGPSGSGEAALMRDLTNSAYTGYDNLVETTGAPSFAWIQTLLGLNLYSDGRTGVYQNSYTSAWTYFDFFDVERHYTSDDTRLQPYTSSAAEPTSSHSVRAGSTAYLEWSPPSSHAPTSLQIRTPSGGELPDVMGMWIFRIQ